MERKIVKVGNSYGVILPLPYLEELGVSYPDTVDISLNSELKTITIRNTKTAPPYDHLEQVVRNAVDVYLKEKGI